MKKILNFLLVIGAVVCFGACDHEQTMKPVLTPIEAAMPETNSTLESTATPIVTPAQPTGAITVTPTLVPTGSSAVTVTNTPISTSTPVPTPTPRPSVTLTMVGDILLHTRIHTYSKQEDGSYNYDAIFTNLAEEISAADLAIVNQEVMFGGKALGISGYPSFNAPEEVGDALVKAGFDVVLHATNHALDKKAKGVRNTLKFWEETYPEIGVLGIHDSAEDQDEIYVTEVNGIRIAILNYTYGTNGIAMPEDMPYAVDMLKEAAVIEDIQQAKQLADFIMK